MNIGGFIFSPLAFRPKCNFPDPLLAVGAVVHGQMRGVCIGNDMDQAQLAGLKIKHRFSRRRTPPSGRSEVDVKNAFFDHPGAGARTEHVTAAVDDRCALQQRRPPGRLPRDMPDPIGGVTYLRQFVNRQFGRIQYVGRPRLLFQIQHAGLGSIRIVADKIAGQTMNNETFGLQKPPGGLVNIWFIFLQPDHFKDRIDRRRVTATGDGIISLVSEPLQKARRLLDTAGVLIDQTPRSDQVTVCIDHGYA